MLKRPPQLGPNLDIETGPQFEGREEECQGLREWKNISGLEQKDGRSQELC